MGSRSSDRNGSQQLSLGSSSHTVSGNQIVFATSCASHQLSVQRVVVEAEGVDTKIANLLMTLTGWV